ncbi:MAG TPA: branched-chain amino acid ABC transporter permease [Planctomycetota bacterium]|nr:branched-chain amino acid ABC transporter permease [Planctomycetota bacterium]
MPTEPSTVETLVQQLLIGFTNGTVFALIALGYTMVYGIIELINFAHGDLFMLGSFLALTLIGWLGLTLVGTGGIVFGLIFIIVFCSLFCGALNWSVDRIVYRPLRSAPKLAPLVSAIGVSFIFQNIGLFWGGLTGRPSLLFGLILALVITPIAGLALAGVKNFASSRKMAMAEWLPRAATVMFGVAAFIVGLTLPSLSVDVFAGGTSAAAPKDVPNLISRANLFGSGVIQFTGKDLLVVLTTVPIMVGLTLFVKYTKLGKAMRATAQNPTAARLMGIDVDRVIGATFLIGGCLAGAASVIYAVYINTVNYQIGYQNGLYAFTAAVIGGIGNIPGAMLGGILIGVIRALSDQYIGAQWQPAVLFGILILILIFRPSGLLGARVREKV